MHFDIASPSNLAMKAFRVTNSVELRKSILFLRYFINYESVYTPKDRANIKSYAFSHHIYSILTICSVFYPFLDTKTLRD